MPSMRGHRVINLPLTWIGAAAVAVGCLIAGPQIGSAMADAGDQSAGVSGASSPVRASAGRLHREVGIPRTADAVFSTQPAADKAGQPPIGRTTADMSASGPAATLRSGYSPLLAPLDLTALLASRPPTVDTGAFSVAPAPVVSAGPVAAAPCLQTQTCGTATFGYTGGSQSWFVPAGVQSVYVTAQGGQGGYGTEPYSAGVAVPVGATVLLRGGSLPAPVSQLQIVVGGNGGAAGTTGSYGLGPGAGGFNGGGSGGSGSEFSLGGGGGGGATSVSVVTTLGAPVPVLVAGGGGGGGASAYDTDGGNEDVAGQGGASGYLAGPPPGGVWPGGAGSAGAGSNPGAGGAGGSVQGGTGSNGGDAETLSGNGGGGGGGGGWYGGAGGQPGQASASPFSVAGPGGGGGGGSSYADPAWTVNPVAVKNGGSTNDPNSNSFAQLNWVAVLTTSLAPLRVGRPTDQQLSAVYALQPVSWQVTAGTLPKGLSLSPTGELTGTPRLLGRYSFQVTVSSVVAEQQATSVLTYSGRIARRLAN